MVSWWHYNPLREPPTFWLLTHRCESKCNCWNQKGIEFFSYYPRDKDGPGYLWTLFIWSFLLQQLHQYPYPLCFWLHIWQNQRIKDIRLDYMPHCLVFHPKFSCWEVLLHELSSEKLPQGSTLSHKCCCSLNKTLIHHHYHHMAFWVGKEQSSAWIYNKDHLMPHFLAQYWEPHKVDN